MQPLGCVILVLTIVLPSAWLVAEFKGSRGLRLLLGILSLLMSFGVAFIVGSLDRFNSNAWFGAATKELVDTTINELDAGHKDEVVRALKDLQAHYRPNYENRSRYDELVSQAVEQMKKSAATRPIQ